MLAILGGVGVGAWGWRARRRADRGFPWTAHGVAGSRLRLPPFKIDKGEFHESIEFKFGV